jgi:hypothetical protein
MKKLITLFSAIIIYTTASAQIPNPGFETWDTTSLGGIFYVPVGWDNLDSVTHLLGTYSCNKGTPGFAGSAYVNLTSFSTGGGVVPGLAVSGKINYVSPYAPKYGFPLSSRPAYLSGEWQYRGSGTDTGFIAVFLSKWNLTSMRRDTVGFVKYNLGGSVTSWTAFNIRIPYYLGIAPDSAIIALSSSKAGAGAVAGSYLYIDTLQFTGSVPTGTITLGSNAVAGVKSPEVSVFPNPAKGIVNISFTGSTASVVSIAVSDLNGRIVKETSVKAAETKEAIPVDISGLTQGVYFIRVTTEQFTEVKKLVVEK